MQDQAATTILITQGIKGLERTLVDEIEVFQDLNLDGPHSRRDELRAALIDAAVAPWRFDSERSAELLRNAATTYDVIHFKREKSSLFPEAGLTLWGIESGYYVSNITPLTFGQLTYGQYNAILDDFVAKIVVSVVPLSGYTIRKSKPSETPDDWLSPEAASKLRNFSAAANKSTGASHPMDEGRWFGFLVAAHRNKSALDAQTLARWLHETEKWDANIAYKLAGDYEHARNLLKFNDEN